MISNVIQVGTSKLALAYATMINIKRRTYVASAILATTFTTLLFAQLQSESPVEWNSTAGTSVLAKFIEYIPERKSIVIEKADGSRLTVPVAKLTKQSRKAAQLLIAADRDRKNTIGKWYWRCPAPNEPNWRINSTLKRNGKRYELTEVSSGHSTSHPTELVYIFEEINDIFIPIDGRNHGEKRSPFRIDKLGDRISYNRSVVVNDRTVVQGGDFLDISYADRKDAENWARKDDTFSAIQIAAPIHVGQP